MRLKITTLSVLLFSIFWFATINGCENSTAIELDPEVPTIFSTSPENGASNVERNKIISISFNQAMDASTINNSTFTLANGSEAVTGTAEYSGTTARFTPDEILKPNTDYILKLSTDAKNTSGISVAADTDWSFTTGGHTETMNPVELGLAGNYVIVAKTAINNNPNSDIDGDVAISPAAASMITGFALADETAYATSSQISGRVYATDMAEPTPSNLATAIDNMTTAYNDAADRTSPDFAELYSGNISGKSLAPGLYTWGDAVIVSTDITLSGGADDVWIFQIDNDLTISSDTQVTLSGGAQSKNIFWQVAGEVTVGTNAHMEGVILSQSSVSMSSGASLNGRILAQTAVLLDKNMIAEPQN